ncbi:MAG TPA: hypothetical protein PLM53_13530 [Spirochaetota bacterium]|nr:hypothetical protein [Spirochaetota bacterium]HQH98116.1 hypothetical protein [Spirochaetota bacterium]
MNNNKTETLKVLVNRGAYQKYGEYLPKSVVARLKHESQLIAKKKLEGLFLFLHEMVEFAVNNNILLGPGRGFAASSIINYSLGITSIDPIEHDLVCERLFDAMETPQPRFPMMYIDVDYKQIDEIRNFIIGKYNKKAAYVKDNDIDGNTTNSSICIVLTNKPFKEGMPVYTDENGSSYITREFRESSAMPDHYFIKLIGQKSLQVISGCLKIINKIRSENLNLSLIPLDDAGTYRLLSKGKTKGISELDNPKIRKWLRKFKPGSINGLCVVYSLAGSYVDHSMEIKKYIYLKEKEKKIEVHPYFQPYLADTCGMVLYQEQVMRILNNIGNFSPKDSVEAMKDILKEKQDKIMVIRLKFLRSTLKKSIMYDDSCGLFDDFLRANALSKSHYLPAVMILYWMAYLKTHYCNEFTKCVKNFS